jgi:hypothetical protein
LTDSVPATVRKPMRRCAKGACEMMLALFRARLRALLMTIALTLAAPRVAGWLRHVGERQRRRGRPTFAWRAPIGVARALEQAAGKRRGGRLDSIRRAGRMDGVRRAGRRAGRRVLRRG